jgi:RNA recognition motif-containing protein
MSEFPILQIKNLPFNHNPKDLYTLFGQFGNIIEIRTGSSSDINTRGNAIVVYSTLKAANLALEKLYGFNYHGRYLTVKLYIPDQYIVKELATENNKENH